MKLRVGIIGTGWGGQLHLEAFRRSPGAEVVALCGRTPEYGRAVAHTFGIDRFYTDYREMVEKERPDILTVATPPPFHYEMSMEGIRHGCHVLCEKPMGMSAEEAQKLYVAAEAAHVKHATGFIWRNDASILQLRQSIREGLIGRIWEVQTRCALGTPPMPYTWLYERSAGGGSLMQHGSHVIDRIRWLLGDELVDVQGHGLYTIDKALEGPHFHNVSEVFGWRPPQDITSTATYHAVSADTGYAIWARAGETIRVSFWESWPAIAEERDVIEIYGIQGTLRWVGGHGLHLLLPRGEKKALATSSSGSGSGEDIEVGHKLWQMLVEQFIADINGSEHTPYPTFYDGWQVHRVIDAILRPVEQK